MKRFSKAAAYLKALAHPTRLMIISQLQQGRKCVGDIRELARVRQSNVSQHLMQLRALKIVACQKRGRTKCYRLINRSAVIKMLRSLSDAGVLAQEGRRR